MAFNREDLITWHELSTSLQDLIKTIQNGTTNLETKVDQNIEKTNELDGRVTALEESSESHTEVIKHILDELEILDAVSESSLLRTVLELKAKLEFHKIDPNAHRFTIDNLMRTRSNNYYSTWRKIDIPNLKEFLRIEATDHSITNSANLHSSYDLGETTVVEPEDYEEVLKSILEEWISKFTTTDRDIVIAAIKQLHQDIFEHIWSSTAHNFHRSIFIGKNVNFVFEKGYKAFLPSKTIGMIGIDGNSMIIPQYTPIEVDPSDQYQKYIEVEKYLVDHLVSTDHGLDTLEGLFNRPKIGYDTLTLVTPEDHNRLSAKVIGRTNIVDGGVDGPAAVEGMTFSAFSKFIVDTGNKYQYGALTELRTKWANHISLFENSHKASVTDFLIHSTNTYYPKGYKVRIPGIPSNLVLQATNSGMSNPVAPNFDKKFDSTEEVAQLITEVNLLKTAVQGDHIPPVEIAARATAIRQDYLNHLVANEAHVFTTASTMTHSPKHEYQEGEIVYAMNLPSGFALQCVKAGKTGDISPKVIADTIEPEEAEEASQIGYEQYITDTIDIINEHEGDSDAHFEAFGEFLLRAKGTRYSVGDVVWAKGMNPSHMLQCITPGVTSNTEITVDIESETNQQTLANLLNSIMTHTMSTNSHKEVAANRLMHKTNEPYSVGETVFVPGLSSSLMIMATTNGITSTIRPNFLDKAEEIDPDFSAMESKLVQINGLVNPTDEELAPYATDVAQLLNNHKVQTEAHYYNGSSCLKHTPKHKYEVGDTVYAPRLGVDMLLECVTAGYSADTPPADIGGKYPEAETAEPAIGRKIQKYMLNINKSISSHESDEDAHDYAFAGCVLRMPNTEYEIGDKVILSRVFKLECVTAGITSSDDTIEIKIDPNVAELNRLINIQASFIGHLEADTSHFNNLTRALVHHPQSHYQTGDVVMLPGSPNYLLQATNTGNTADTRPKFDGRNNGSDSRISENETRLNILKSISANNAELLAAYATEIAQSMADHEVDTRAHYYSNANCMRHMTKQFYKLGDVVIAPNMDDDYKLQCIKTGVTGEVAPKIIDDPDAVSTKVAHATADNLHDYIDQLEKKLADHDKDDVAHAHEFGREELLLPNTEYKVGDIAMYDNVNKVKCIQPGITGTTRIDLASKSKLARLIDVQTDLVNHAEGINVHINTAVAPHMHKVNTYFSAGTEIYVPGVPNGMILQATTSGYTAMSRPAQFTYGRFINSDPEVDHINSRIETFRKTNPTASQLASFATEVAQEIFDHNNNSGAHFPVLGETHATNRIYYAGDEVYLPAANTNRWKLHCVKSGMSASTAPAVIGNSGKSNVPGAAVDNVSDYINHIRGLLTNHTVDSNAHYIGFHRSGKREGSHNYYVGDVVDVNLRWKYECIQSGKTS